MRRSPRRSALRADDDHRDDAERQGIALTAGRRRRAIATPVDLMIDGSQKLTPYSPIELVKYTSASSHT